MNTQFQILLIDDDRILQRILQKTLQEQGYHVLLASSGEVGLEQIKMHHPHLVICDWLMEGMDGLQVCHWLKSHPEYAHIFFILLTSRAEVADRVQGLDTGADDFLSKPIDTNELIARVRAGLRLYQATQEVKLQKQRLEAELTEAADYVRSLLPAPMTGNIQIASCFLPCGQLGGDCLDFYWLDDQHLLIYLLDVSGHGLAAALPSISVHHLLRSQALPKATLYSPSQVLRELNTLFQMERHNERYFTIWYGVYDCQTQELRYASAGHPPALLFTQAHETSKLPQVQALRTPGLGIGLFSDAEYITHTEKITLPATLYIFSDGIYEVPMSDNTLWGLQNLSEFLQKSPAQSDLGHMLACIQTLTGNSGMKDDRSIIRVDFGNAGTESFGSI
jgi:sigma-B regulation protein RsbU (phosphoserine phosphatase)